MRPKHTDSFYQRPPNRHANGACQSLSNDDSTASPLSTEEHPEGQPLKSVVRLRGVVEHSV